VNPKNYIELGVNCRQKFDEAIIKVAELFGSKNRYWEEIIERLSNSQYSSPGLSVQLWGNKEELFDKIDRRLSDIIRVELKQDNLAVPKEKSEQLNLLFGLYDNGHVQKNDPRTMKLDRVQLLTPYRAAYFGALGINKFVKDNYRKPHHFDWIPPPIPFTHSEKIIRITNWYTWNYEARRRELLLSNGSIGVVCNKHDNGGFYRRFFFADSDRPIDWIDDDENFELAYVITVHKSQGSEFKNVFLVVPNKSTLISKELLYTALTRSTDRITLFIQEAKGESILEVARKKSFILPRMTSIFELPEDYKRIYEPKKGDPVKSKIEYILYKMLESSGLVFRYEKSLQLTRDGRAVTIHPDFTVEVGGTQYYWEHLGELDMKSYSTEWIARKELYAANGLADNLVTTDDMAGVRDEIVSGIIDNIKSGRLQDSPASIFSKHHYKLYG
jgi:hypothetical protein